MVLHDATQPRLTQLINRHLGRCTPELFRDYGLEIWAARADDTAAQSYQIAGVMGFVGDFCGTLLLGTSQELLSASHPLRALGRDINEGMQLDWVGELANQLMGRLKVRLGSNGIQLRFSTPISLTGDRIRHIAAAGRTQRSAFRSNVGPLSVWVDGVLHEAVESREAFFSDEESEATEGAVTLF
jgi:CheY-specific phosphatase CheX